MMQPQRMPHLVGHDLLELYVIAEIAGCERIEREIGFDSFVKGYAVDHSGLESVVVGNTGDRKNSRAASSGAAEIAIAVIEGYRVLAIERVQAAAMRRAAIGHAQ